MTSTHPKLLKAFVLFLLTGFVILFLRSFQFGDLWKASQNIQVSWLLLALVIFPISTLWRAIQWRLFIRPLKKIELWPILEITWVRMMGVNVFPFWIGEGFPLYLLSKKEGLRKAAAVSVLTQDHVYESLSVLAVFGIVIFFAAMPSWMKVGIGIVAAVTIALYLFLMIIAQRYGKDANPLEPSSATFKEKLFHSLQVWASHLRAIRSWKPFPAALALSLGVKLFEALCLYFIQRSMNLDLPWWAPFVVIAALNLTLFISISPGNLGVFESTVYYIYHSTFNIEASKAMALGIIYHCFYAVPVALMGYFIFVKMGLRWEEIKDMESPA